MGAFKDLMAQKDTLLGEIEKEEKEANPALFDATGEYAKAEEKPGLATDTASVVEDKKAIEPEVKESVIDRPAEVDYEHRYRVLQGKYNKEMPSLYAQVKDLRAKLDNVKYQPPAANVEIKTPENSNGTEPKFGAAFKDEFGDEYAEKIDRLSNAILERTNKRIEAMEATLNVKTADLDDMVAQNKNEKANSFFRDISSAVPDYQQINDNEAFHAYLYKSDGFSGQTIDDALKSAQKRGDADTVIKIFKSFKDYGKPEPIQKIVTPKGGGGGGDGIVSTTETTPEVTQEELNSFHLKMSQGYYKTRPKEKAAVERRIDKYLESFTT